MALNLVVATTTAMVIVNTTVLVLGDLGRTQSDARSCSPPTEAAP